MDKKEEGKKKENLNDEKLEKVENNDDKIENMIEEKPLDKK
jgi:hypothetical protein